MKVQMMFCSIFLCEKEYAPDICVLNNAEKLRVGANISGIYLSVKNSAKYDKEPGNSQ